jgi:hypothetical protein
MKKKNFYRKASKSLYILGTALLISAIILNFLPPIKAQAATRVTLCHATPPDTAAGGWGTITTDISSDGHLRGGHDTSHDADIIPSYTTTLSDGSVFVYPGKNLTTVWQGYTGQEILDNDCTIPTPPPPTPDSVSVTVGSCVWGDSSGSFDVTFHMTGAAVTLVEYGTVTDGQTVNLPAGPTYNYSWTPLTGYTGSGGDTFQVDDCPPPLLTPDSVSITVGSCVWGQSGTFDVIFHITGAAVTLDGYGAVTDGQTVNLPAGPTYPYSWTPLAGYTGSGSDTFQVNDCIPPSPVPDSVSVTVGTCSWNGESASFDVTFQITGAVVTLDGYGAVIDGQTLNLPAGVTYTYSWTQLAGYTDSGSNSFGVADCTPPEATASIGVGTCSWTPTVGPITIVTITIEGSIVNAGIYGGSLSSTTILNLGPGSYSFPWIADSTHKGSGTLDFSVLDCTPGVASAIANIGTCSWNAETGSSTPVDITIFDAIVHTSVFLFGDLTTSQAMNLAPGTYSFPWEAQTGYYGSGTLDLIIGDCPPPPASADPTAIGECTWSIEKGSTTPVTITIVGASVDTSPIDGLITTTTTLPAVPPGLYSFPWTALPGYTGSGNVEFTVGSCVPSIQLTAFCSYTSPNYPDGWTATNLNAFDVPFDWQYGPESSSTTINLPGSSSATFTTGNHPGDEMQIYSHGEFLASSSANTCPAFQDLQLITLCADDPTQNNEWVITNPNSGEVNFEYTGAGGVAGTGAILAKSSLHLTTPITTSADDLALFVDSVPQAYVKAATKCTEEPLVVLPPPVTLDVPIIIPVSGATQPPVIIIPVTGKDTGLQQRALPGTLMSFSLGFLGMGLVLGGFGRRRRK